MSDVQRLRKVIRDLHGVESSHLRSERVREELRGETLWEGTVEVFALKGHPKAGLAYGWSRATDEGGRRYIAVLGVHPIKSALDAVRVHLVAEYGGTER
jgi:hypothetical protein